MSRGRKAPPRVSVVAFTGRDTDGELIGRLTDWEGDDPPPIRLAREDRQGARTPGVGDRVLARLAPTEDGFEARVMKLLPRRDAEVLGVFRAHGSGGGRVQPVDKRQLGQEVMIAPGAEGGAEDGDLVSVTLIRTDRLGARRGTVRERLGTLAGERAASMIAIHAHDIPHVFPPAALAEAAAATLPGPEGREDWRALPLITIDPADAKDHDDAVHAGEDPDPHNPGGFVITVAIADVAALVPPGSAMDREALTRGNSVYFPDRVVPMLPERISNDLCSLRPEEDRPALAIRMVIGADGQKRGHSVHRILMRSAARLAYEDAQAIADGRRESARDGALAPLLEPLFGAYRALSRARDRREPLALELPERRLLLSPEGRVVGVRTAARLDVHRLIEEMMILANVAAAETLEERKSPLLYRVHDAPSLAKLEALRSFLASLEIGFPKAGALRPSVFNRILAQVAGTAHEPLLNEVVLRSQSQAEYAPENIGHFGLHLRRYAHFTSPIRRYADLVVHRALIRALDLGRDGLPEGLSFERLQAIGARISAAERRAMAAERDTQDRLLAAFMAERLGATFPGRVSGVTRSGLFVRLDDTGADGFIPAATLGGEFFAHDEAGHALVGTRSGAGFRLGDPVEVRLVEAAPIAGALRFLMLSEPRPLADANGKRGRRRGWSAEAGADQSRAARGHRKASERRRIGR